MGKLEFDDIFNVANALTTTTIEDFVGKYDWEDAHDLFGSLTLLAIIFLVNVAKSGLESMQILDKDKKEIFCERLVAILKSRILNDDSSVCVKTMFVDLKKGELH